ncbi:MAG: PLP-dependent aminotransferase family protein [Proteobacteria bacterium]|nr:MAG: PLP-dependent aminotransferase family protein [Pseudomonadota bacterium]
MGTGGEPVMQLPIRIDDNRNQGLQLQVFEQIRGLILDGRLRPGTRLPASRMLADDLGISRNTVVLAYDRLRDEGYLEVRKPNGTYVSSVVIPDGPGVPGNGEVESAAPDYRTRLVFRGRTHVVVSPYDDRVPYDFWVGRPDARLFPAKTWQTLVNQSMRRMRHGISTYTDPAGLHRLRTAVAEYVGLARGIKADADQVMIINGTQEGLNVMARLFVRADTPVVVENPGYLGAANVFESYGARLISIPVDGNGVSPEDLPNGAALYYLTPSHQYPTGVTLSMERRERLLQRATRLGGYIVEDDYDADFYYDSAPLPALKSLDTDEQVVYLGTFSKSLGAGLRLGYMILPRHLVEAATTAKALLNNCSPWLSQASLAEFIESGGFMHHLRRIRQIYRARRDVLLDALGRHFGPVEATGAQSGMHLAWRLPDGFPEADDLERRCRRFGVGVYSVPTGNARASGDARQRHARTVMMGYAGLDETEIAEGVSRLSQAAE